MTPRHLPPFAALRAFEAVARTLSFTRAAEELGVTQAAVSRQVRALEQALGVRLVDRLTARNALSAPGKTLFAALRDGMDCMEAGVQAVSSRAGQRTLTVSVAPFFSACWLTQRIMGFIEANPALDLRLQHSYEPPDYRRDHIDLGINWGDGRWSGVTAEKVFDGSLTPLCSPEFLNRCGKDFEPADLARQPLFCEFHQDDWVNWFQAAGVVLPDPPPATRIDDSHALRKVALEGHGVALFFRSLAEDDLAIGRLVQPFDLAVDTGCHYFLNYPSDRDLSAGGKRFQRWLRSEL